METAPTTNEVLLRPTQSQSDEPSDLRGSLSPTSVYSTWQSQAVTHPTMSWARRCLTSVSNQKLWVAVARHNFKSVKIEIYNVGLM